MVVTSLGALRVERGMMMTYLISESIGSEITQRKLESPVGTIDIHLDGDGSIRICR